MKNKKLLCEVTGDSVIRIDDMPNEYSNDVIYTHYDGVRNYTESINSYELAHKGKEWARSKDYSITTGNRNDGTTRYDVTCVHKDTDIEEWDDFFSEIYDTEPEATLEAGEWVRAHEM